MGAHVDYCGEIYSISAQTPLIIGRGGALSIDDNPYLHRHFLEISEQEVTGASSIYWLANIGSTLSATVADAEGLMQAWLAPGARVPLVFTNTVVWFTAGPTTYEFEVVIEDPAFRAVQSDQPGFGATTIGRVSFTPDQKLLIVALAENVLRRGNRGAGAVPTSADAARRLDWTITKFNRKLDNVCDKLSRSGVRGLHGSADRLATSRRARLVEYALAARLVAPEDLALLRDTHGS